MWSDAANQIIFYMIKNLSTMKYVYNEIFEGCYLSAIKNYGYVEPEETIEMIIDEVKRLLNSIYYT